MKPSSINLDFRSQQQLKGIYLIYILARNLNSYMNQQSSLDESRLYWSTSFIQAHFACEILCHMNWPGVLETSELSTWSIESQLSPVGRMQQMLNFCYAVLDDEAPTVFHTMLSQKYENRKDPCAILCTRGWPEITHRMQSNFQNRFVKMLHDPGLKKDEHAVLVFKMLRYIYSVRDHFFQGYAYVTVPLDENMQLRFQIYSDVLLTACEFLYYAVEQISNWQHQDVILANQHGYGYAQKAIEESHLRNTARRNLINSLLK